MSDFDIEIKVDADKGNAELARSEQSARRAETAFDALTATFGRLAKHQQVMAAEAARARVPVDHLVNSFAAIARQQVAERLNTTAKAFAGLTEQIGREQAMFERLHGPMKQAGEDFRSLEMLWAKGLITAEHLASEVDRLSKITGRASSGGGNAIANQRAQTQQALDTIGLNMPQGGGANSFLNSKLGGVAAGGAAVVAAHQIMQLDQSFANAQNSVRKFADTNSQLNSILAQTTDVGYALHMTMEESAKVFGDVGEATRGLYLTTKQQVEIMRGLGEIAHNDGGSIEEYTGILKQLQYAMDSGTISGRELKGMMKQSDDLADLWTQRLGLTRQELVKMANAGQVGSAQIREMILALQGSAEIHEKHEQRTVSLTEKIDHLVHRAVEPLTVSVGRYQAALEAAWEPLNQTINLNRRLHDTLSDVLEKMEETTQMARMASGFVGLAGVLKTVDRNLKDVADTARYTGEDVREGYHDAIDKLNRRLDEGTLSQGAFDAALKKLNAEFDITKTKAKGAADAIRLVWEEAKGRGNYAFTPSFGAAQSQFSFSDISQSRDVVGFGHFGWNSAIGKNFGGMKKQSDAQVNEDLAKWKQFKNGVLQQLQPVEDAFVELARTGEMSWSRMIDSMLENLTRLATHELFRTVVGRLFGSATQRELNDNLESSFSVLSGGSHAFGGTTYAPNTGGGQDSIMMVSRVSPGERIDYTPQGKAPPTAGAAATPAGSPSYFVPPDPRALLQQLGSPEADRMLFDWARRNARALKPLLS